MSRYVPVVPLGSTHQRVGPRVRSRGGRAGQRGHIDELIGLLHPRLLDVPEDAGALARYELTGLSQRIGAALAAGTAVDAITRAHLSESKARIDRALEASVMVTPHAEPEDS